MIGWTGVQPESGKLQHVLNSRISGLSPSHACFKVVEYSNVRRIMGMAGKNGDTPVGKIPGDSDQCHSCGNIGKMGLVGWSAALAIKVGRIGKWGHVSGDHYMPIATQCIRQRPSKGGSGFLSKCFHLCKYFDSGEFSKFSDTVVITTADYGLTSPTGASIGPPAMTDESRILTQWDNFIASKVMQVFHRPADASDFSVD